MFEPCLFFLLTWKNSFVGFPISISRILHIIVLLLLLSSFILKLINKKKLIIINNFFPENKYLVLFLVLSAGSLIIGIIYGSYNLPANANTNYNSSLNIYFSRTVLEYIILFFNIFYFAILPRHLINTKIDFDYFFKIFYIFLIFSLLLGYADYLIYKFSNIDIIGRHIRDNIDIGLRFHGIGGEPRQAGAQLIFFTSVYLLSCIYFKTKIKFWIIFLLILALLLTFSTTVFASIIFLLIFIIIFREFNIKMFLIMAIIIISMYNFDRVQGYFDIYSFSVIKLFNINQSEFVDLNILNKEFYPLYDLFIKFNNYEFPPILFGNGLGSASAINNFYLEEGLSTRNPNIQSVRLLYEHGVLGTIIFIMSMIWPIKYYTNNIDKKTKSLYLFSILLVMSVTFAIRSPVIFIYLGILTSFIKFNEKKIIY